MGVGYHGLQLMRFASRFGPFGRVATIGRQELFLKENEVTRLIDSGQEYRHARYCDSLLMGNFGATSVDSWDYSGYEGASHIADMNKPLPEDSLEYDTVIDGGSLEHVYNVAQALSNVSRLCRDGGQILHISPANNFCGHGFWQFSPELFFSLYSKANGYSETRVFLATDYRTDLWYEVGRPSEGRRVNIVSFTPVFALCRTVKTAKFSHESVQQSDYAHVWEHAASIKQQANGRPWWREKIKEALQRSQLVDFLYFLHVKLSGKCSLSSRNPYLTKFRIDTELK